MFLSTQKTHLDLQTKLLTNIYMNRMNDKNIKLQNKVKQIPYKQWY